MWKFRNKPKLEISPGFILLMAAMLYLDEGAGLMGWAVLACLIHEGGHVAAALCFGGRISRLSMSVVGAELSFEYIHPLSYGRDSLVVLAGPAVNLLTGVIALWGKGYLFAALSFGIGAFNLLPIRPLDGGRLLYNLAAERLDQQWAERLLTVTAGCLIGVLVGVGGIAAAKYANMTLLLTALWLLVGTIWPKRGAG